MGDNIPSRTTLNSNFKPEDFFKKLVDTHRIVLFTKSWCTSCLDTKKIFGLEGLSYKEEELDLKSYGASLHKILKEATGQSSVPYVFVNGRLVGGHAEVVELVELGLFREVCCTGIVLNFEYDLVVIGGGSGGLSAAKHAALLGKKVAVCDYVEPSPLGTRWGLGGTCVNVGCIPKKLMHRAASLRHDVLDALEYGWQINDYHPNTKLKWEDLVTKIQNYIKSLNFEYKKLLIENKIKYFNSFGSFIDRHTLLLSTKKTQSKVTARNFLIAVGGRPHYPDVEGAKELCITSDDLFSMKTPPGKTLIVGGSYIALECAGILLSFGYDVTVLVRSTVLRNFDRGMAARIQNDMARRGVKFELNTIPLKFVKNPNGTIQATVGSNNEVKFVENFDTVLLAAGRNPCTDKLNLDIIGVQVDPDSKRVITDVKDRTTISNIFAVGDVAEGRPELTPVAVQAGKYLAYRLYGSKNDVMEYDCVPSTIFTPCEYGFVGLSEEEAQKRYGAKYIDVYHKEFTHLEAVINPTIYPKNYAKLVVRREGTVEYVVGVHLFSLNAGEVIQGYAFGIKGKMTKKQFDDLLGIHPTIAEVFTTLDTSKSSGSDFTTSTC